MAMMSRNKGIRAEQDIVLLLQPIIDSAYNKMRLAGYDVGKTPTLQRNTLQSDDGGCDVAGLPWCAIEVKHHAHLKTNEWWKQTLEQAERCQAIPILIYKMTGAKWHARVMCNLNISEVELFPCYADIGWTYFIEFFWRRCMYEAHLEAQRRNMTLCPQCHELQIRTPSGLVCKNGHGY